MTLALMFLRMPTPPEVLVAGVVFVAAAIGVALFLEPWRRRGAKR